MTTTSDEMAAKLSEENVADGTAAREGMGPLGWLSMLMVCVLFVALRNTNRALEWLEQFDRLSPWLPPSRDVGPEDTYEWWLLVVLLGVVLILARARLRELLFVAVLAVSLPMLTPRDFKTAPERARIRACYANQKTIAGAIEMYNLDKNTKRSDLDQLWSVLNSGGYLPSIPNDPGHRRGSHDHYRCVPFGCGITCTVHGPIQ